MTQRSCEGGQDHSTKLNGLQAKMRFWLFSRKFAILTCLTSAAFLFYVVFKEQNKSYSLGEIEKRFVQNATASSGNSRTGLSVLTTKRPIADIQKKIDDIWYIRKMKIRNGLVKPEDLMKSGPFDFLPNYRNPCWKAEPKSVVPIKCLPYFYLAGAPKAGTTDLYYRIIKHPSVSQSAKKEPHWLPRSHFFSDGGRGPFPTLNHYISIFKESIRDVYGQRDHNNWHRKVFGDGSASTLWDNYYWNLLPEFETLTEPRYTNADYIYHLNPNAKIIAILRNPIDRLYSDFLFFRKEKNTTYFHNDVKDTIEYMNSCFKNHTIRHCIYHAPPPDCIKVRIHIGIYFQHLKEYYRVFPKSQILVLKLEEYSKNVSSYMRKVFEFLELEPMEDTTLQTISRMKQMNSRGKQARAVGDMLPQSRKLLYSFYHPFNEELAKLMGPTFNYNYE